MDTSWPNRRHKSSTNVLSQPDPNRTRAHCSPQRGRRSGGVIAHRLADCEPARLGVLEQRPAALGSGRPPAIGWRPQRRVVVGGRGERQPERRLLDREPRLTACLEPVGQGFGAGERGVGQDDDEPTRAVADHRVVEPGPFAQQPADDGTEPIDGARRVSAGLAGRQDHAQPAGRRCRLRRGQDRAVGRRPDRRVGRWRERGRRNQGRRRGGQVKQRARCPGGRVGRRSRAGPPPRDPGRPRSGWDVPGRPGGGPPDLGRRPLERGRRGGPVAGPAGRPVLGCRHRPGAGRTGTCRHARRRRSTGRTTGPEDAVRPTEEGADRVGQRILGVVVGPRRCHDPIRLGHRSRVDPARPGSGFRPLG